MSDRRRHPRHSISGAYLRDGLGGRPFRAPRAGVSPGTLRLVDIGPDGLSFECRSVAPEHGRRITLDLFLPEEASPTKLRGTVAWIRDIGKAPPADASGIWRHSSPFAAFRVGVRLDEMPTTLATRVQRPGLGS